MKVIGLDPGSQKTGWGILERSARRPQLIAAGTICAPPRAALPQRLAHIHRELVALLERERPGAACVEQIFHAVNAHSLVQLAQARGVVLLALAAAGIPVFEYTPLSVKQAVVGYGRATKEQVLQMVRHFFPEFAGAGLDASDAVAVALCHLQGETVSAKIARLTAGPEREGRAQR
jgi:crossover junction endodeoxyribonuclease RuvC